MLSLIRGLLAGRKRTKAARPPSRRARLRFDAMPEAVYAIGDVHGQLELLRALEAAIAGDAEDVPGEKWMVLLGDFVDRGPDSARVLDYLASPPAPGFTRLCLAGNHEIMMLDALEGRRSLQRWLELGGLETLLSYGISADDLKRVPVASARFRHLLDSYIPEEHLDFLRDLPVAVEFPEFLLVHAGLRPGVPLDGQSDEDLTLAAHDPAADSHLHDKVVVHGHRIVDTPLLSARNINVDTGAYLTGRLTAVRLSIGKDTVFLETTVNAIGRIEAEEERARR